jgi:hypothetical protein
MKFYDTHYEEYIISNKKINMHTKLEKIYKTMPKKISELNNIILYGPSGVGKYTQMLCFIKRYSPSNLKYEKKLTISFDKKQFLFKISDIHYEIDMGLLGCNAKLLWHDIYQQIVDIISSKTDKSGIIVCKNFHEIHSELLDNFYSYIQHYNYAEANIKIKFFILSEHVSFIPEQIIQCSQIINVKRPAEDFYEKSVLFSSPYQEPKDLPSDTFLDKIAYHKTTMVNKQKYDKTKKMMKYINKEGVINTKEIKSFDLIDKIEEVPKDIFNIVCDKLIENISDKKDLSFTTFRENLYDILTYNIDIADCIFYILGHFIKTRHLNYAETKDIISKTHTFLKYYNNNYRPIYHLESMMFYIINRINK